MTAQDFIHWFLEAVHTYDTWAALEVAEDLWVTPLWTVDTRTL